MSDAERYLAAAQRESTRRRYAQAIEHFEAQWGGWLPASSESVVRYLAVYGAQLSGSTLKTHLAALARWHQQHGFSDPTKSPRVRDTLRGIQALHPQVPQQAAAVALEDLERCVTQLQKEQRDTADAERLRAARDQLLLLLGFWRALRADELCRLRFEHVRVCPRERLELFLPSSKTDRDNRGRTVNVPALKRLCPVDAFVGWKVSTGLQEGPVFRSIDRWGHIGSQALNSNSLSRVLRQVMLRSGLTGEGYSGHSLRRGFATWASRNQWSARDLMTYVGWRDIQSAIRYVDAATPFGEWLR
ncbi:site-specific integrase [Pseudomonas wadenswilerensis]|uniref:XerD-like integrase/recombinase n=1 Tax=Pseudomonas wadenswilerensis TaxID=1785161 RepID=A0A380T1P1_9PSED|nr:site-specific integrase [Pseudomonas wadenswilerensis]SUQ64192.1 xerD-like integrase/recombinase [Pseudomonas wadenswilerensis]